MDFMAAIALPYNFSCPSLTRTVFSPIQRFNPNKTCIIIIGFVVYAMLGLCAQSLLASFFVISVTSTYLVSPFFASVTQMVPYSIDLLSLGSSICLFITRFAKGIFLCDPSGAPDDSVWVSVEESDNINATNG